MNTGDTWRYINNICINHLFNIPLCSFFVDLRLHGDCPIAALPLAGTNGRGLLHVALHPRPLLSLLPQELLEPRLRTQRGTGQGADPKTVSALI